MPVRPNATGGRSLRDDEEDDDDDGLAAGVDDEPRRGRASRTSWSTSRRRESATSRSPDEPADFEDEPEPRLSVL